MSNEELVLLIQQGQTEYILQLWEQIEKYINMLARRRLSLLCGRAGVTFEDLKQSCFIGMLEAVQRYDPKKGFMFTTYLEKCIKRAFHCATNWHSGRKQPYDLLDCSISIDEYLSNGEGSESFVADILPDPYAEVMFDNILELDERQRMSNALNSALDSLPEDQQEAIRARYYRSCKYDTRAYGQGIKALRHPRVSKTLRQYAGI